MSTDFQTLTPHQDVNHILAQLSEGLTAILGSQLVGLYLTGSLTYGDFDSESSDIDFLAVLSHEITLTQRQKISDLHARIAQSEPMWADRIEGSYITRNMLTSISPPETARPYVNDGKMWDPDPRFGQEWLINLYALRERGLTLDGPDPKDLIAPVDVEAVRSATRAALHQEWEPLIQDLSPLDSYHQAYITLTLCRILHSQKNTGVASKRVASAWAKDTYGSPWNKLIEKAEDWRHGQQVDFQKELRDFIKFTVKQVG